MTAHFDGTKYAHFLCVQNVFLNHFQSIRPKYQLNQSDSLLGLVQLRLRMKPRPEHWDEQIIEHRIRRFGFANACIETRGSELSDFCLDQSGENQLFQDGKVPALEVRMDFFKTKTTEVMRKFYEHEAHNPHDLIHVSCTGYTAPNAAQEIAASWKRLFPGNEDENTTVTNAYHMGCYASLPAIRMARGLNFANRDEHKNSRVDIVHQELCSLHFDPLTLEPEQIVVQSLFADGHIRYSLTEKMENDGLKVLALREEILSDTLTDMSWVPSSTHFKMHLSREVPNKLKSELKSFLRRLLREAKILESDQLIFAIHPGGPKIIEAVEQELGLHPEQTTESHEVLRQFGNMSSATLPHIWQKILDRSIRRSGQFVVSMAFGPGLSLSGGVFELCRP